MNYKSFERAVIFDLDGTLWDALSSLTKSWNKAMVDNNLAYRFDQNKMKSYMGLTPEETAILAFNDVPLTLGMKYFSLALKEEIKYLKDYPGKLYPNEREVLKKLKEKYPLFIVSNSDKGYIENYLSSLKMDEYFLDHLSAGDTNLEKWQNILLIKDKYKIKDYIYVGDTLKDYNETKKANGKFIHCTYGFGKIEEDVPSIKNLDELIALVDKLFDL